MIVTTTSSVEGRPVKEYLGVVSGEAVMTHSLSDIGAAMRNLGNRRSHISERILFEASQLALEKLAKRAQELGADAVVGISIDYEDTENGAMAIAYGTAVKLS